MNRRSFFKSLAQGVLVAAATIYCPSIVPPRKLRCVWKVDPVQDFYFYYKHKPEIKAAVVKEIQEEIDLIITQELLK